MLTLTLRNLERDGLACVIIFPKCRRGSNIS